ncbi:MAG: hypothetical protein J2P57_04730 [Acidimicrobiaceae bacterium]|nr:hypothetical protein [Acidimicrobiaceae bacterium]
MMISISPALRAGVIAWFAFLEVFVLVFLIQALLHGALPVIPVVLAFAIALSLFAWRWVRMAVIARADELVFRNLLGDGRIPKWRVDHFYVGGSRVEFPGRAVRVVLVDGTSIVLGGTGRYLAADQEIEHYAETLAAWRGVPPVTGAQRTDL